MLLQDHNSLTRLELDRQIKLPQIFEWLDIFQMGQKKRRKIKLPELLIQDKGSQYIL